MPDQFLSNRAILERTGSRQQVVKRDAQAVNVRAYVGRMAVRDLLGRQIVGGPQHGVGVILLGEVVLIVMKEAGQAHVKNLDRARAIDQQVARLDVAMYEAGL